MKRILKKIFILTLTVVLLTVFALPCLAQTKNGSISLVLEDENKNKLSGITVYLSQVAEFSDAGYYPTKAFEDSDISISGIINNPDEASAKSVADYVIKNKIETLSAVSDKKTLSFTDLNLGIWVVFCDEAGEYAFNPFMVVLPYESDGRPCYEVLSAPKIQDNTPSETSIYVIKKWDDKNNAAKKRPEAVKIELISGSTVVSSVELSEANGWAHTFEGVSKNGEYSIREENVSDYKAAYSGDVENGFIITNLYVGEKLPQTGQYWWPIAIIAIAGLAFILLGIFEIGSKKNVKKK